MKKISLLLLPLLVLSCMQSPEKVKLERYRVAGERLYLDRCANCHQMDGEGFKKLYPPIDRASIYASELDRIICLLESGSNDSTVIDGVQYILPMPPSELEALDIATIVTYLNLRWGSESKLIDVNTVQATLRTCD